MGALNVSGHAPVRASKKQSLGSNCAASGELFQHRITPSVLFSSVGFLPVYSDDARVLPQLYVGSKILVPISKPGTRVRRESTPLWGAPRIHGELLKLGIDVGQTSVAKYMMRRSRPPLQSWKTFLRNHTNGIAAMDLFVVPTISFRLLYGLLIMGHGRRQILWLGVTAHPTAEWIANQLTAACGWEQLPCYLIRDRDACYGDIFVRRVRSLGIRDHPTSPRSPWQNGYAERLIGSIRRECLDHIVVIGEQHLRHILMCYMEYYNAVRTHLSLGKDAPVRRLIQRTGRIQVRPVLGGLHHQYVRI